MNEYSTPNRPYVKQTHIRKRMLRQAPSHETQKNAVVLTPLQPAQPARLIGNPSIFAEHLPNIHRANQQPLKPLSVLTVQAIKASEPYRRLLDEMEILRREHECEMELLQEREEQIKQEFSSSNRQLHDLKIEIWELRNSLMEYRATVAEEQQYYNAMLTRGVVVEQVDSSNEAEQQNNSQQQSQQSELDHNPPQ